MPPLPPKRRRPIALYVHGGGWVFHDLETHDAFCRYLARERGWALLAVDYRRAPEHPYPAPLDDVETALTWLRDHAKVLGVDASFVAGIGDSSGANLVAGLLARDPLALDLQVLMYPPVDATDASPSMCDEQTPCLSAEAMDWFWSAYALPTPSIPRSRRCMPAPMRCSLQRSSSPQSTTSCATRSRPMPPGSWRRVSRSTRPGYSGWCTRSGAGPSSSTPHVAPSAT